MQTLTLEGLSAPRVARQAVAQRCKEANAGPECAAIAAVATSEVVTNAVIHGAGQVRLGVSADPVRVRVEVGDDNPGRPSIPPASDDAESGRGMRIVDATCSAWGVFDAPVGKIVWFEVPAQP